MLNFLRELKAFWFCGHCAENQSPLASLSFGGENPRCFSLQNFELIPTLFQDVFGPLRFEFVLTDRLVCASFSLLLHCSFSMLGAFEGLVSFFSHVDWCHYFLPRMGNGRLFPVKAHYLEQSAYLMRHATFYHFRDVCLHKMVMG